MIFFEYLNIVVKINDTYDIFCLKKDRPTRAAKPKSSMAETGYEVLKKKTRTLENKGKSILKNAESLKTIDDEEIENANPNPDANMVEDAKPKKATRKKRIL